MDDASNYKCAGCGGVYDNFGGVYAARIVCPDCFGDVGRTREGGAPEYAALEAVLGAALERAKGKGHVRHGGAAGVCVENQHGLLIRSLVGPGFFMGQILKKLLECIGPELGTEARCDELLDVIVYAALEVMAVGDKED